MSTSLRKGFIFATPLAAGFFAVLALAGPGDPGQPQEQQEKQEKKAKEAKRLRVKVSVQGDGAAVEGANVFIKQGTAFKRQSSTNSQGIATFSDVPPGTTLVQVTAPGYQPYSQETEFTAEESSLNVTLDKDEAAAHSHHPGSHPQHLRLATIPSDAALRHFPALGR